MILLRLRRRWSRTLALTLGLLAVLSCFVVLTSATETSRLAVVGTLARGRGAYDILLRSPSAVTGLEARRGLVRPNFLGDTFGGVTFGQLAAVRRIAGVAVAAPIATLGYVQAPGGVTVDLATVLPRGTHGTFRLGQLWTYDNGLSRVQAHRTVYLTTNPLMERSGVYRDGRLVTPIRYYERRGRHLVRVCASAHTICLSWAGLTVDGRHESDTTVGLDFPITYVIAGVDPTAEAALVGLDHAVGSGRYLPTGLPAPTASAQSTDIPLLRTAHPSEDLSLSVSFAVGRHHYHRRFGSADALRGALRPLLGGATLQFPTIRTTSPVHYDMSADGTLHPRTVRGGERATTPDGDDVAFRSLRAAPPGGGSVHASPDLVGTFDPAKLPDFAAASRVPLGTYRAAQEAGADRHSRIALDGRSLAPGDAPTGYVQQPPMMLTNLAAVRFLGSAGYLNGRQARAPISAIRVRVAGVTGADRESRERVRLVAEKIAQHTGLAVDVVLGSSPSPQTVALPAGEHGRPALTLREWWSRKHVVTSLVHAVERKSIALLLLILVTCALFIGNASAAAVRSRRAELGVLSALGWPRRAVAATVLGELVTVGAVAGVLGGLLARPVGAVLGAEVSWPRAALAVPVGVAVAVLGGLVPVWRAGRVRPMAALRAPAEGGRRRLPGGPLGLALANLLRVRARAALGATAVAVATAAVLLILAIQFAFHQSLVGSLLGQLVSVQIHGADEIAAAIMVVLAVAAVVDVLYLNVTDRGPEFATLRAIGWPQRSLRRIVLIEGVLMGCAGAVLGAGIGVAAVAVLSDGQSLGMVATLAAAVALGAVLLTVVATPVSFAMLRRRSTTLELANE
jgi:hypothetical protein